MGEKKCKIVNSHFSYILKVDGNNIPFQGSGAAEYFEEHYLSLGYKVVYIDENDY